MHFIYVKLFGLNYSKKYIVLENCWEPEKNIGTELTATNI